MNYTAEMEKAMQQSHNMAFPEYERRLDQRLAVEKRRQNEYEQCKKMINGIDGHNLT